MAWGSVTMAASRHALPTQKDHRAKRLGRAYELVSRVPVLLAETIAFRVADTQSSAAARARRAELQALCEQTCKRLNSEFLGSTSRGGASATYESHHY